MPLSVYGSIDTGLAPAAIMEEGVVPCLINGTIVGISVAVGDVVAPGESLAILNSMKMESVLPAPYAGKVTKINVQSGAVLQQGDSVLVLEPLSVSDAAGMPTVLKHGDPGWKHAADEIFHR